MHTTGKGSHILAAGFGFCMTAGEDCVSSSVAVYTIHENAMYTPSQKLLKQDAPETRFSSKTKPYDQQDSRGNIMCM